MRTLRLAVVAAALMLSIVPGAAFAQEAEVQLLAPRARQGYYFGGGPRIMSVLVDDEDFGDLGSMLGFGGAFRFGQKVNDWLGLGLVFTGGAAGNEEWGMGGGGLLLETHIQPWVETDLAFRAGIGAFGFGVSRVDADQETDDDPSGTFGSIFTLGVSYELFPWYASEDYDSGGGAFSLFVEGQFSPGSGGLATYGAVIGIEFTWWTGIDRNKLELPEDAAFIKDD